MNIPFTNKELTKGQGCLLTIVLLFVIGCIGLFGKNFYGEISPYSILLLTIIVLGVIVLLGSSANKKYADDIEAFADKKKGLSKIAAKYNSEISRMETSFKTEISSLVSGKSSQLNTIRKTYQAKYQENKKGFEQERKTFLNEWKAKYGGGIHLQNIWQWAICIGFIAILGACSFSFGVTTKPETPMSPMQALMETRSWNADNIPMPHMENGDLYVSNPDSILSQEVEDSINIVLRRLDEQFDIESAMVIVGHIDNDDPVAMVRGIYNNYGVGRNDRGLVIVVGYLDHSYFIAPGRSLEGDLTDLECNHLAQDYLIPSMKAEMPDSGMLYLARGTYALMSEKDMPHMSALKSSKEDEDLEGAGVFALFMALFGGWGYYGRRMSRKLGFADMTGTSLRANPFFTFSNSDHYGGGGIGGGSSWGGSSHSSSRSWGGGSSHSSGGYGGGSWGGGGSGGRW